MPTLSGNEPISAQNLKDALDALMSGGGGLADLAYPVGAIYLSTSSTSPATLFGGTWQRIQDQFLLCAGTSYAAGSTGGEATHTLTVDEMPSHSHRISNRTSYMDGGNGSNIQVTSTHANAQVSISAGSTGGSQPHNNMPPYLTVYAWKRTA